MSKGGFDNEDKIKKAINGKAFPVLNPNLQHFVKDIFSLKQVCEDVVKCKKRGGMNKSDIEISLCGKTKSISIKTGTGNSVHQEGLEGFISFLKKNYNIPKSIQNDIRFFVWGDGTLNGSGDVRSRLNANELQRNFPEKIKRIQDFFDKHKKDLVKRFVVTGVKSNSDATYIYYGTTNKGHWVTSTNALDWLCNKNQRPKKGISVGRLTFQAWNRNINGGKKSEHKRGVVQLKWGSVGSDIKKISNTYEQRDKRRHS